jgi:hypothetical protein
MAKTEHTLRVNRIKAGEDMMEARNAEKKCRDLDEKEQQSTWKAVEED